MKQVVKQVVEKVAELNTKEIEVLVARLDMRQAVELDMTQAVKPVAAQMPRIRTLPAGECRFWPTAIALRRRAQYNPTPHWNHDCHGEEQEASQTIPVPLAGNEVLGQDVPIAYIRHQKPAECVQSCAKTEEQCTYNHQRTY